MKTLFTLMLMLASMSSFAKNANQTYGCSTVMGGAGHHYGVFLKCTNIKGKTVGLKFGSKKAKGLGLSWAIDYGLATLKFDGVPDLQTGQFACEGFNSGFVFGISRMSCQGVDTHNRDTSISFRGAGINMLMHAIDSQEGGNSVETKVTIQTLPY